ncbi:MAG TPA: CpaF family protein [Candidatus Acidoferrales bacterium]|nr:CpaF family protein [Candidatus Acidoferrales bacterium]
MAVQIPGINIDEYYAQLGPIQPLITDDRVTEVMVNGTDHVYVEMAGKVLLTNIRFENEEQLLNVIQFIVRSVGRRIDDRVPIADARLADGSRVNAVIRPLAVDGPSLTIRKFARDPFQVEDLVRFGSCSEAGFGFLKACVLAKANVVVSGGTGTGKTTFLNVLSGFIPVEDRIVTIEDAAELQLHQEHVVRLETRPKDINGEGEITIQRLVINSLRMRPERIVVGECRSGEALDMLQAMNTGHDGSMTTLHANSPRDALARLETLVLMAGVDLPVKAIRQQVASAINVFCQLNRLRDGSRRVTSITEVMGMEGETITMQEIFRFDSQGASADGKILGEFAPTGIRPQILDRMFAMGLELPTEILSLFPDPRSGNGWQRN